MPTKHKRVNLSVPPDLMKIISIYQKCYGCGSMAAACVQLITFGARFALDPKTLELLNISDCD